MSLISREYIADAGEDSLTYMIEISNLQKKLRESKIGEKVETEVFTLSWTSFKVGIYLHGADRDSKDHVSLYLYNESDWLVKAEYKIRVKTQYFWSSSVKVFEARSHARNAWGRPRSIPHSRCNPDDLLTPSGSLLIEMKVNLVDELVAGGHLERRREHKEIKESLENIRKLLQSSLSISPQPTLRSDPPEVRRQENLKQLCQEANSNEVSQSKEGINNNGEDLSEMKIKKDCNEKIKERRQRKQ